jgi:mono/diheme cytochrome c family protein
MGFPICGLRNPRSIGQNSFIVHRPEVDYPTMIPAYQLSLGLGMSFAVLAALGLAQPALPTADDTFFEKKIAPIFKRSCLACHNPDKARGGLDLSTRESTLTGGDKGPAIVPGDAAKSLLARMVRGPGPKMPKYGQPLSDADVALILHWIEGGAPWPKHFALSEMPKQHDGAWWSLQPLKKPAFPGVKDAAWAKNVIDRFILAVLEAKGMTPSAEAGPATLIRRITFDLHGLPPTPQEVEEFVKAWNAPNAKRDAVLEQLVDRLLASPRYGERWARLWLDLVHYADTHGYDKDKKRLWAWLFRDWVIRAFNSDMPYRRFIRYQVAGDVLFPADPDGIIATGFIVAGPWDFVGQVELREGTIDKEKTRVLDRDDMVANTLSTFCSLTVHCARCHDHKFDPIPMKEYYQLQAVFAGVERGDRAVESKDTQALKAELQAKRNTAAAEHESLLKKVAGLSSPELKELDGKISMVRKQLAQLPIVQPNTPSPTNGYHSGVEKTADAIKWVQVDLGKPLNISAVRLLPARPIDFADSPGFGFPARYKITLSNDEKFASFETLADHTQADVANPGDQPVTFAGGMKARYVRVTAQKLWKRSNDYVFALGEMQVYSAGKNVALGAEVTALDSIEAGRWSVRYVVDDYTSRNRLLSAADGATQTRLALEIELHRAEVDCRKCLDMLIGADTRSELAHLAKKLETLDTQLGTLQNSMKAYATMPIPARPIHVLARGDVERKQDLALPGALGLLKGMDHHFAASREPKRSQDEGARRAALGNWIADDANVLTWRCIANRVWQYHFGKGLVDTPSDFGRNGSPPTHPELLDYLASEFRTADSFKRLHRMILLSATYRQASTHDAANAKRDADNRYLWRMNRQRLDAESIRDSVLSISGKMDFKMYGPGYELFRFKDDHSPVYDHLDVAYINRPESWRRTVYRFVVRSVPNPFLETLDCADPNINVPVRNSTMTALQALALLNNPFMVKQAEYFAERIKAKEKEPARQVDAAFHLALGRPATEQERTAMSVYIQRHGLANACRLLLNANEFMFVD